ncbi:MAG: DUF1570 domain-containing protein, partial [Solirubrobacterales bacterium]
MRKEALFIFLVVAVLSSLCINCGGADLNRAAQATPSSGDLSGVLTSLQSLADAPFEAASTEHFTIIHEVGSNTAATGRALESTYHRFYDVFAKAGFRLSPSADHLVWICFPQQSGFNKYALQAEGMDLSWLDGYYSTLTNRVAVVQPDVQVAEEEPVSPPRMGDIRITLAANRQSEKVLPMSPPGHCFDVTRLTHELAHQLAFNSGIQKRGVMYPIWVSEGLATNFECDGLTTASVLPSNAARRSSLATAYAAGELVPLRQFIVQTRVSADIETSRARYAQAWAFFRFLLTEYPTNLRTYLQREADLPGGRRDANVILSRFAEAFGSPESL